MCMCVQARAAMLCERERELQQREKLFLKHQCTMNRLLTVEEDVLDRINAMQQVLLQHTHTDTHYGAGAITFNIVMNVNT